MQFFMRTIHGGALIKFYHVLVIRMRNTHGEGLLEFYHALIIGMHNTYGRGVIKILSCENNKYV